MFSDKESLHLARLLHDAVPSLKLHDSLNQLLIRLQPLGKQLWKLLARGPVGYPGMGVDCPLLDQTDNTFELCGSGVASSQQGNLFPVELRVAKRHVALEKAHENQLSSRR